MTTNKNAKNAKKFYCEKCNFSCSKKSDYNRHTSTRKHEMITLGLQKTPKKNAKPYM